MSTPITINTKLAIIGSGAVGKSCFTLQYVKNTFVTVYDPTIEDSHQKQILIDDIVFHIDITDTAGQEDFISINDITIRQSKIFILLYSIAEKKTFWEVDRFYELICRVKDTDKFPIVIVGNKCDLESERQVTTEEGKAYTKIRGCPFFEASAKTRTNIDEAFATSLREFVKYEGIDKNKIKENKKENKCVIL